MLLSYYVTDVKSLITLDIYTLHLQDVSYPQSSQSFTSIVRY